MSQCRKPRRNLWLMREVQAAAGPLLESLEHFWQDTAVTCVWRCPEKRLVVRVSRWHRVAIWKLSATRSAKARRRWKGSLLSSETVFGGWALWRPVVQALRGAGSWRTRWEAIVRFSAVPRRNWEEVEAFRIRGRTRPAPLGWLCWQPAGRLPRSALIRAVATEELSSVRHVAPPPGVCPGR